MEPRTLKLAAMIGGPIVLVLLLVPQLASAIAPLISLVVILAFVAWMGHRRGWFTRPSWPAPGADMTRFGQPIRRPRFLDEGDGLFRSRRAVRIYRRGHGGRVDQYQVWDLFKRTPLNERRLLEVLSESARLLRKQRGHEIADAAGQPIDPPLDDAGVLVDVIEDETGQTFVYAVDLDGELSPGDYIAASDAGIGRYRGAWRETPHAVVVIDDKPDSPPLIWAQKRPASGFMPLFNLILASRHQPARASPDPLAPPSTEKGSARWGNPFADQP